MVAEAWKSHVKGNSKDSKKRKHKRNMYVLKTESKRIFKGNQCPENVTKYIIQTETPLDQDPVQKTTGIASNSSKQKYLQIKFLAKSKPFQKAEILIAMKSIISHISHNRLDNFAQLRKIVLTDSTKASDLCLGQTKIG